MSCERLQRETFVLRNSTGFVLSEYPIHFAGATISARNDASHDSVIVVHESADGANWDLVLVSTHSASGLPSVTIAQLSFQEILFVSDKKYVRISLVRDNESGVFCSLTQFPPKARIPVTQY